MIEGIYRVKYHFVQIKYMTSLTGNWNSVSTNNNLCLGRSFLLNKYHFKKNTEAKVLQGLLFSWALFSPTKIPGAKCAKPFHFEVLFY